MLLNVATSAREPGILVIELSGRIVLGRESSHLEDLVEKAIADGARNIVMDLAGIHVVDSSGIGIITLCFGRLSNLGGRFCVAGATGEVLDILKMARLDSIMPFAASVDEACALPGKAGLN